MIIVLRKRQSKASRGSASVDTTRAIITAVNPRIHRLNDTKGIEDHRMLINIYPKRANRYRFDITASPKWKFRFSSTSNPAARRQVRKIRSGRLPSFGSPPAPNQIASGLLAISSIHTVGSKSAAETFGLFFASSRSKTSTYMEQMPRAANLGTAAAPSPSHPSTCHFGLRIRARANSLDMISDAL